MKTYPLTEADFSAVSARWAAEAARPFLIFKDRCLRWLVKEGRPERYFPNNEQVAKDVKTLYSKTKDVLALELQVNPNS